jgi:inosine/xanthosine triphosphatase
MKTIIVASENPVKIAAVENGFRAMFSKEDITVSGVNVPSGVSHQPMTNAETEHGAQTRVANAKKAKPEGDFWVGIEGGVEESNTMMESFAWIVIQSKDGYVGKGKTGTFILPFQVADLIKGGKELGEADDIVFQQKNSKQQNGAVGILTGNVIDRTKYYTDAVILALIPFKHKEYYQ